MEKENIPSKPEDTHAGNTPVKTARKPGEMGFLAMFTFMAMSLLVDSFKLPGIVNGKLSSPSSVPQVMLFSVLVLIAITATSMLLETVRERKAGIRPVPLPLRSRAGTCVSYLAGKEVIILLLMVFVYVLMLPLLRFEAASMIFLSVTMYLLERKNFVKKVIISAGALTAILVIFKYLMRVVLP